MELDFLIDKKYIFLHAFNQTQKKEPVESWFNFISSKKERYPQQCALLQGNPEWKILDQVSLKNLASQTEELIEEWLNAPEPKKLINQTEKYQEWLRKEWNKKGKNALRELEDIIKISLPQKTISVYVTHPKLHNGVNFPEKNIICWGHPENWENYSIVYLCHEILHILTYKKFNHPKIMHALIELATDNELRVRLNKGGIYFKTDKYQVGHPSLIKLEKEILPLWKEYLKGNSPSKNLLELEEKIFRSKGPISER